MSPLDMYCSKPADGILLKSGHLLVKFTQRLGEVLSGGQLEKLLDV
jgi:hypothetical protein